MTKDLWREVNEQAARIDALEAEIKKMKGPTLNEIVEGWQIEIRKRDAELYDE